MQESLYVRKEKRIRRSFNEDFNREAVNLVVKQGYSFKAAAEAVNVSTCSLREWHEKLAAEREPEPCCEDTSMAEFVAENERLRKKLLTAEMERGMLKTTAYLVKESK